MKKYDFLIVGSGLFGATFAHFAHKAGKKCFIIEKRSHLGGNIYCEKIEGINVHKYGAHIFHTNNKQVWNFVNSIVEFNRFTNSPLACFKDKLYNLPFNMNTFHQIWGIKTPKEAINKLNEQRKEALERLYKNNITQPTNLEEQALLLIGKDIYETLIKGYTEKQWGRKCSELPPFIINRLPVRMTYDNNYFSDAYQGIPIGGYNKLIDGLIKGINYQINTDFFENRSFWETQAEKIVYTGPIDKFYNYKFGKLEYRTVLFKEEILDTANYQGNAVINFTEKEIPHTRIIEHKHFELFGDSIYDINKTVISKEYSKEWTPGMEPYYPINDLKNNNIAKKYKEISHKE